MPDSTSPRSVSAARQRATDGRREYLKNAMTSADTGTPTDTNAMCIDNGLGDGSDSGEAAAITY